MFPMIGAPLIITLIKHQIYKLGVQIPHQTSFLSCNGVILSTNEGGQIDSVLYGHGPNEAFLVTDSCRATERNGYSISADITDDTIEND